MRPLFSVLYAASFSIKLPPSIWPPLGMKTDSRYSMIFEHEGGKRKYRIADYTNSVLVPLAVRQARFAVQFFAQQSASNNIASTSALVVHLHWISSPGYF